MNGLRIEPALIDPSLPVRRGHPRRAHFRRTPCRHESCSQRCSRRVPAEPSTRRVFSRVSRVDRRRAAATDEGVAADPPRTRCGIRPLCDRSVRWCASMRDGTRGSAFAGLAQDPDGKNHDGKREECSHLMPGFSEVGICGLLSTPSAELGQDQVGDEHETQFTGCTNRHTRRGPRRDFNAQPRRFLA